MKQPGLQHFETFLTVARQQSITGAAKELGISKAAVSHAIRSLEQSLKVPLFLRSTRKISLTTEGELLLAQCLRLQTELDTTRNLLSRFQQQPSGTLRISSNPYLAESLLLKPLQTYQQRYPDVTVEVVMEERMPDLAKEQIDLVFGINWPAPDDVVARQIGKTRYVLCASPDYLKQHGTPSNVKDLEKHRYIPHIGRTKANIIADLKKPVTLNLHTPLKAKNADFMRACAKAGMGIIQLHDYMVTEDLNTGSLVEILRDELKDEIPLYIYYQKQRYVQPKVRKLVELLL